MQQRSLPARVLRNLKDPALFRQAVGYWAPELAKSAVPIDLRLAWGRARYARACTPFDGTLSADEAAIVEELRREGVKVIPNYMARDAALDLGKRLLPHLRALQDGSFDGDNRAHRMPDYGVYRILDTDTLDPAVSSFLDDPSIVRIAQACTCADIKSHQRMAELRSGVGKLSSADIHHFDEVWSFKFKSFLYLTDVTPETGPFSYVKRSLHGGRWRRQKEREALRYGKTGTWGHFFLQEIDDLKARYGFEEQICTGAAGTLILADTRGIHRSTTLQKGERILLANYFER